VNHVCAELSFWKTKPLADMTRQEWESLCDGCARCCLEKIEDADTGEVAYTCVACPLLDSQHCRCRAYADRHRLIPDCLVMTPASVKTFHWLPRTCAYRLIAEGRDLPSWHPLVSGDPDSVHRAGISVRGKVVAQRYVDLEHLEAYIIGDPF
jgi:uncharacterized cysteine cluster protein YcgN (CxxCxxCC family)